MTGKTSNCIALGVPDRAKAVEHYTSVVGFELVKEGSGWTELASGALRLFICADDVQEPVFDLQVPDTAAAEAELSAHGWQRVQLSPDELYMRDPFGYLFCISPMKSPT